ncbi:MAG: undecaprenyl-phosphate glucose phosphotransferase, partial [Gammaproteobacteria bacterium]|nr:undecaprenyl-phosphate glucose phosphotransferase [Gammaproteobacteria bacterium]
MLKKGVLKGHGNLLNLILRLGDLVLIGVCGVAAYFLSNAYETFTSLGVQGLPGSYIQVIMLAVVLSALTFPLFNIYRVWRGSSTLSEIKYLTIAWIMVAMCLTLLAFITKSGAEYSRSWMGIWFAAGWVALVGSRVVLRYVLRYLRSSGFNHRHIVIVGTGDQAAIVADRLQKSTWFGLEISALFSSGQVSGYMPPWLSDKKIITRYQELRSHVDENGVDQVWISLPHSEEKTIRDVINALEGSPVEIRYVPDIFEYKLMHHSLSEVAGVPVVNISYSAIDGANKILKTVEDYVLATILLIFASPLMVLIAIGVKFSSSGPVLYRQKRVGWNGKEFTMLKFRSMPVTAEHDTGPIWASKMDKRATPFGSFLRKTSLDELPQLFNVLRGEMSLIGPRPERPVFVEQYKDEVPHYNKKHLVKAGLTGWAQVHGWRGNTCLHTRIEHDLYYIENWSLWLDIKIIIMTIFRGLVHK